MININYQPFKLKVISLLPFIIGFINLILIFVCYFTGIRLHFEKLKLLNYIVPIVFKLIVYIHHRHTPTYLRYYFETVSLPWDPLLIMK